ncbi:MAG: sigma-70 family RNA polymerase sigma factor [Lachnospiraceae bacterium]|nr:sigma-70 family RNA polymerase sigma factor [Lachnospiraceae bacterium]MBP5184023.1 sigma-70 family RNA polymerase sigma factor [Lachnospiraceae bacterium]
MKDYKGLTDNELIEAIRGGDNGALDFLMNKYKNLVRGKAKTLFLVGGDRDDLIQEGMIGLYMAIRDYEPSSASFSTFADICTTRRMYKAIERSTAGKNKPLSDFVSINEDEGQEELFSDGVKQNSMNPESIYIDMEEQKDLFDRIRAALSPLEYDVLMLYIEDYGYKDIARKVNRSPKAVDNAVQRIRKKIKEVL